MPSTTLRHIIVPTDFSPLSEAAARRALTLAREAGASLHLLHALDFPLIATPYASPLPDSIREGARRAARESMEAVCKQLEACANGVAVTSEVSDASDAAQRIRSVADARGADLVVMGTHGHGGLKHAFLGSVAERTLRTARCPVLAVKEDVERASRPIRRILLAVDFSAHSDRATEHVGQLAGILGASVDVLHVFDLPHDYLPFASARDMRLLSGLQQGATSRLDAVAERLGREQVPVTLHVRRGHPSEEIAAAAEELRVELIVVGTRGHSGLSHVLLGSVAERTLRCAACSVLAVPPADAAED